jgi:oligoribonuclease
MNIMNNIVWIDLETTGLNMNNDTILEVACVITDYDLNIVDQMETIIIHKPMEVLERMENWCRETHGRSGLVNKVLKSGTTLEEAEYKVLEFVKRHVIYKKAALGGNTVYFDRAFLSREMPRVIHYLHYRIIDVSSIADLAKRWYPNETRNVPKKLYDHRALTDILESINELKYYKSTIFKSIV